MKTNETFHTIRACSQRPATEASAGAAKTLRPSPLLVPEGNSDIYNHGFKLVARYYYCVQVCIVLSCCFGLLGLLIGPPYNIERKHIVCYIIQQDFLKHFRLYIVYICLYLILEGNKVSFIQHRALRDPV